jgi:hypothetical protein
MGRRRTGRQAPVDATPRAEKGELGEDHSDCTSDQQLQPGVVQRINPVTAPRDLVGTSEFNGKRRPKAKGRGHPSRGPGRHRQVRKRLPRIIDRCEAEGVTNTLDVWEICRGDPDLEWLAQSIRSTTPGQSIHRFPGTSHALSLIGLTDLAACRAVWVFWTWPVAVEMLERRASGLDDGCRNVAQLPIAALG